MAPTTHSRFKRFLLVLPFLLITTFVVVPLAWGTSGNAASNCIDLPWGQTVSGYLPDSAPEVAYCFTGKSRQYVSIRMFDASDSNPTLDTIIYLYDANHHKIGWNDDGDSKGIGYNSFLNVMLPNKGTYQIVASRYSDGGNFYLRIDDGRQAASSDVNRDCIVNDIDGSLIRSALGSPNTSYDIDLNDWVNTRDWNFFLNEKGTRCPNVSPVSPTLAPRPNPTVAPTHNGNAKKIKFQVENTLANLNNHQIESMEVTGVNDWGQWTNWPMWTCDYPGSGWSDCPDNKTTENYWWTGQATVRFTLRHRIETGTHTGACTIEIDEAAWWSDTQTVNYNPETGRCR